MVTKIKLWAAGLLAVLIGIYGLRRKQANTRYSLAKSALVHLEAERDAEAAGTVEARATFNVASKKAKDESTAAAHELRAIDARLTKRKAGRLGQLLKRFEETEG